MNILVTGANGQLGHEMQRVAKSSNHNYIFTDVADGYEKLDITNIEDIRNMVKNNNVDIIVNCAAYTNVDKAESNYDTANLINNTAAGNLATAIKEAGGTLIHISTDYVFQGDRNTPCQEDWATNPLGVYGKTKLAGEAAIATTGCNSIIIRTAWLYSQWGKNFVKTMQSLTATHDTLKVVFDQVGTPTFAGDLADVIAHIINTSQTDKTGIYHFSNEGVCSWYDFAKLICKLSGNTCDINPCYSEEFPSPVKRPHFSVLDKKKIKETFGIKVPYWTDSLEVCIKQLAEANNK
ncbi:dTDP-4-dehydrorhamnose reductase [uncultured Prevotella sp.]|uniref:dTDP-4-dehydrorhamnose reductase n=1 Tax=uncultured Prevotella sp. TaxID=159272 RepID=UPI0025FAC1C3|nr:dTDP-4-dehydrorhamnose reductase [uncultured Prevotella sp.]